MTHTAEKPWTLRLPFLPALRAALVVWPAEGLELPASGNQWTYGAFSPQQLEHCDKQTGKARDGEDVGVLETCRRCHDGAHHELARRGILVLCSWMPAASHGYKRRHEECSQRQHGVRNQPDKHLLSPFPNRPLSSLSVDINCPSRTLRSHGQRQQDGLS